MTNIYVPSTSIGKTWKVYAYKPDRGPAYVTAIEGEYKPASDGEMFDSFTFEMFKGRQQCAYMNGRNTAKNRAAAAEQLHEKMVRNGMIAPDTPVFKL